MAQVFEHRLKQAGCLPAYMWTVSFYKTRLFGKATHGQTISEPCNFLFLCLVEKRLCITNMSMGLEAGLPMLYVDPSGYSVRTDRNQLVDHSASEDMDDPDLVRVLLFEPIGSGRSQQDPGAPGRRGG